MNEKFVEIHSYQLVEYLNKGYEIVASHQETYTSSRNIHGQFMNNSISLNDVPVVETQTKYVMKRGPSAEVLYGSSNNNQS